MIFEYLGVTVCFTQPTHVAIDGYDNLDFVRKLGELFPYIVHSALAKGSGGLLPSTFTILYERVEKLGPSDMS